MPKRSTLSRTAALGRQAERFRQSKQEFDKLDYFCKGTVLERWMKCGQPSCPCHTDPAKRHGPYWQWTYKVQGKTVNVQLSTEAGPIYKAAAQQYRRLKSLLNRLEKLSRSGLVLLARKAAIERKI